MALHKSVAPFPFNTPFVGVEIAPGSTHDLPDSQLDGTEIVYPAEFWQPVDTSPPPAPVVSTPVSESE